MKTARVVRAKNTKCAMESLIEIQVAVAIIRDDDQRILVTQRPSHVPHGGFWEFPGGKVENGEEPEDALKRELKEELGIVVQKCSFLTEIRHVYPERKVCLLVYLVDIFSGQPICLAGQLDLRMVPTEDLIKLKFPEANKEIFDWITGSRRLA